MRVAFGTDEVSPVTEELLDELQRLGYEVSFPGHAEPWAEVGLSVGRLVSSGQADVGIVFCFTGTGVCMAANKVPGARAALCVDDETARGARRWNDANVLALSLRLTTVELGREIIQTFLRTSFDSSEAAQVAMVSS